MDEKKKKNQSKIPSGKVNIIRRLNLRLAYFSEYFQYIVFLTLTHPSRRKDLPEYPETDVQVGVLTPPSGKKCVLCYRKTKVVFDWQFEKTVRTY